MSYPSAYKLLDIGRDLPDWKHKLQHEEASTGLVKAYAPEQVPGIFQLYLKVLGNKDVRELYDSLLEWSEEEAEVDFGNVKVAQQELAESMHFEFEHLPNGKVRIHNKQIPDVPPPPAASSEETESTESAYTLLDVPPDLSHEAMTAVLTTVANELVNDYGSLDDLPIALRASITTLNNPARRKIYDSLLQWSANEEAVDFGAAKEAMREQASEYHFTFADVDNGKVLVINLGIPNVPPPPSSPPNKPREQPAGQAAPPPPRTTHKGAGHGLVNGQVPPVALGMRVFEVEFARVTLIHAVNQGSHIYLQWSQPNRDGTSHKTANTDYLLTMCGLDTIKQGKDYLVSLFTDTQTRKVYHGAQVLLHPEPGNPVAPTILSTGLWDMFPWWMCFMDDWGVNTYQQAQYRYQMKYEGRGIGPNGFFGHEGWTAQTSKALKTFLYQADYWTRAAASDWELPPDRSDYWAKNCVEYYLKNTTVFSKKQLRKGGLI